MEQTKNDVFISYSRKDYVDEHNNVIPGNEVSKIKEALTEAGITFWFDEEGVIPGEDFAEKITKHIKASKVLVFLSSATANQSRWTKQEIACAHEERKKIIPVLLDDTPFQDSVRLRIAGLDRIDYYINPNKGKEELIKALMTYLDTLAEEEKSQKEEERQKMLQKQLIEEIQTAISELIIKETKLDLERKQLLIKTDEINELTQRERLRTEIVNSNPILKKSQDEIKKLQEQITELIVERDSYIEEKNARMREHAEKDSEYTLLREEIGSHIQNQVVPNNHNKWIHVLYGLIILILISVLFFRSCGKYNPSNNNPTDSEDLTTDSVLEFIVDSVKFKMIKVEGDTFLMGAQKFNNLGDNYDGDALNNESPVHSVTLDSYYIGETEVTQALWRAVTGSELSEKGLWENRYGKGDNYPAYGLSYNDILNDFLPQLNRLTGKNFRLPTEAEWEYAARGGKKRNGNKYSGGNTIDDFAWYADKKSDGTHPAKSKFPNAIGLYDMSGNVWEWCQDWYDDYNDSHQNNPSGPRKALHRVLRGGSWLNKAEDCRVSSRGDYDPGYRSNGFGFRLVLPQ